MDFNTQGEKPNEGGFVSSYLEPGLHEAKIVGVEYIESAQKKTPGMKITFEGKPEEGDFKHKDGEQYKGKTADNTFWLNDGAWPYSKESLIIMADKFNVREGFDAAGASSNGNPEAYVNAIAPLFNGKAARWKFSGEEVQGSMKEDGTHKANWFKAGLARYGFIETLDTNPSKLKFDPNNQYDMKRLPQADAEVETNSGEDSTDAPW